MVSVCDNIYFAFALNIITAVIEKKLDNKQKLRVASFVSTFFGNDIVNICERKNNIIEALQVS